MTHVAWLRMFDTLFPGSALWSAALHRWVPLTEVLREQ